MIRLAVIDASTSPLRTGTPIAQWIAECARRLRAFDVEIVHIGELDLPFFDEPYLPRYAHYEHEATVRWSRTIDAFDAFCFVSPEYNRGYSGRLKNAIDFLAQEWAFKPAGIVSYGASMTGGLRALEALHDVLNSLHMFVARENVLIPYAGREAHRWEGREVAWGTGEHGEFVATPGMVEAAEKMLEEIVRLDAAMHLVRTPDQQVGDQQGIGNPPSDSVPGIRPRPGRDDREEWRRSARMR